MRRMPHHAAEESKERTVRFLAEIRMFVENLSACYTLWVMAITENVYGLHSIPTVSPNSILRTKSR